MDKVRGLFRRIIIIVMLATSIFLTGCLNKNTSEEEQPKDEERIIAPSETYKILHIMSYHSPWEWTDTQLEGFQDVLEDLDVEYKVIQLDAKNNSSMEYLELIGQETRDFIDAWQPDLIFTSDDEAQEYVAKYYVNSDIPIVFSGVNKLPEEYGYVGSKNVTGVLEVEHFVESAKLLKELVPEVRKVAVVFDDSPIWGPVEERMREKTSQLADMDFVIWDTILTYEEYQRKILEYQEQVDAIALIGIFNYKDQKGENVHYREVLQWTKENSMLPDFSYWYDRVSYGTLTVVSVSGYEQGLAAGRKARQILVEGKSPNEIPIDFTTKGQPMVSLARAKDLGIQVDSMILLSTVVKSEYEWEKEDAQ